MPRTGKGNRQGDSPNGSNGEEVVAAPKISAPQEAHGERAELDRLQAAVPPGSPAPPGMGRQPLSLQEATQQMPPTPLGLNAPSARPGEAITSGVGIGPGQGPRKFNGRTADYMQRLAALSDDPGLMEMAMRAAAKGI